MNIRKIDLYLIVIFSFSACTTNPIVKKDMVLPENNLHEKYIDAAKEGDVYAQLKVGLSYEEGNGVEINYDEAYHWYRLAASKGNNEAYFRVGKFYEFGYSVEKSWDNALEWYLSSASTGNLSAIRRLIKYYDGSEVEQSKWINLGMEYNDPYSFFRWALLRERLSPDEALVLFRKSVKSEDLEVKGILSILSLSLRYPFYSDEEAVENVIMGAEAGNLRCKVFLGWLYEFGIFLSEDKAKAFDLYESAARENEVLAIYNLSRFYGEGIFVKMDQQLSNRFLMQIPEDAYSQAASDIEYFTINRDLKDQQFILYIFKALNKDIDAMYNLGVLSDTDEAFQWFWMAAKEGHSGAMEKLAALYLIEKSTSYDPVKAAAWLMVAENRTGKINIEFSSKTILEKMSDKEKLEVSRLFTELFFSEEKRDMNERNLVR